MDGIMYQKETHPYKIEFPGKKEVGHIVWLVSCFFCGSSESIEWYDNKFSLKTQLIW